MESLGIDYSFSRPNLDACASAGVHAIGRYLWPNTNGSKGINRAEYDAIRARGMGVWYIYEEDGTELTGGYAAGAAAAQRAKSIIASQGLPPQPVFFSIDHDFTGAQLAACVEGVKGAASVLGYSETGIYGGYEHIIAMQQAHACGLFFQTYAWSGGRVAPGVHIYQRQNGQTIGGGTVDLCTIFDAANYGMASAGSTTIEGEDELSAEDVKAITDFVDQRLSAAEQRDRRESRARVYQRRELPGAPIWIVGHGFEPRPLEADTPARHDQNILKGDTLLVDAGDFARPQQISETAWTVLIEEHDRHLDAIAERVAAKLAGK